MSASLVGSEMCIRDSRLPPQACVRRAKPYDSEVVADDRRPTLEVTSVSYTHLTLPTICSV
eukprot:613287-Alexandrium_andersonii.AAC.1